MYINKVLKAPDKALQTPEGEAFRKYLAEHLPEEHESLAPYLAHRFKHGDIRLVDEPHQWDPEATGVEPPKQLQWWDVSDAHPKDRFNQAWNDLPSKGTDRWLQEKTDAENRTFHTLDPSELARWHAWYEAKQHPLRKGVNIMDKDFSPANLDELARKHQIDIRKQKEVEQYRNMGQTVHEFPAHPGGDTGKIDWDAAEKNESNGAQNMPEPEEGMTQTRMNHLRGLEDYGHVGDYNEDDEDEMALKSLREKYPLLTPPRQKGWHIKELRNAEDAAAEGNMMGHCFGSEEQPYGRCLDNGDITAYSLRDPRGRPHVTWHYNSDGSLAEMFGPNDDPVKPEYQDMLNEWGEKVGKDTKQDDAVGMQEQADDPYITLPSAEDMESYTNYHHPDYEVESAQNMEGNVGPDTEIQHSEPDWNSIAGDYLYQHPPLLRPGRSDISILQLKQLEGRMRSQYEDQFDQFHETLNANNSADKMHDAIQDRLKEQWPSYPRIPQDDERIGMEEPERENINRWNDWYKNNSAYNPQNPNTVNDLIPLPSEQQQLSSSWHFTKETLPQQQRNWADLDKGQSTVVHSFPDNWTVHNLQTPEQIGATGTFMRNCWQDPMMEPERWKEGVVHHTLNDPLGIPRVAFIVRPPRTPMTTPYLLNARGARNRPIFPKHAQKLAEFAQANGIDPNINNLRDSMHNPEWQIQSKTDWHFADYDYRIPHTAPGPEDSPLTNLEENGAKDIYTHPHYYATGDDECDAESFAAALQARDHPDALVTIHRASPVNQINPGDWVSLSHQYAKKEAMHPSDPKQDLPVWSTRVPASTLYWNGDSINEFGYHGPALEGQRFYRTNSNPELRPGNEINASWRFSAHPMLENPGPIDEYTNGPFWHITHDPNFQIDPNKGPTDASSMGGDEMNRGALMMTDDPHIWAGTFHSHPEDLAAGEYENDDPRMYAAEIVPHGPFKATHRGFGPEYYMENAADNAHVKRVVPLEQALAESEPGWQIPKGGWEEGWRFSADRNDSREYPDSRMLPPTTMQEPVQGKPHPESELIGCTCQTDKLHCPVHGLHPTEQRFDHSWSIPESFPVSYPQSQPRNYTVNTGSVFVFAGDEVGKDNYSKESSASKKGKDERKEHWSIIAAWQCPECGGHENDECTCKHCGYNMHSGEHDWDIQSPGTSSESWSGLPRAEGTIS
jgi:hypothetical protein